ncbi:MAG: amidohydrolase family protein [Gemmatimonadetes bacterium]|nr:amidohydrolase family protein [Gemmatimonadota bacterium]
MKDAPSTAAVCFAILLGAGVLACAPGDPDQAAGIAPGASETLGFTGARLIDGTGAEPIDNAVLVVRDGRVVAAGQAGVVEVPADARRVDVSGRTIIPGIINAHGHVGQARGLEQGPEYHTRENILDQLALYARYGVTTVVSLGEPGYEGVAVRDAQRENAALDHARLFVAGVVMDPDTPAEAEPQVRERAERGVDWAKIRVDDSLGRAEKMPPATYAAVIEHSHARSLPLTAHMVHLDDAKELVRAGADVLGHSVRDAPVDDELIALMRERNVCLHPTLTRELSTFVYAERPAFFEDPFFLRDADAEVIRELERPERQREYRGDAAEYYRAALPTAQRNMVALHQAGVRVAFGTDSGPPARFQGYFEHVEMEMMQEAGMTPRDILLSATRVAAACMGLDEVGTLEPGRWADFVVLERDPLENIRHTRTIESVWIAGNRVPGAADR